MAGFFLIVFIIGEGLIYVFYGKEPALMGLLCLGVALVPVLAVVLILLLMERVVTHADRD
jgi:hypothetical protein